MGVQHTVTILRSPTSAKVCIAEYSSVYNLRNGMCHVCNVETPAMPDPADVCRIPRHH